MSSLARRYACCNRKAGLSPDFRVEFESLLCYRAAWLLLPPPLEDGHFWILDNVIVDVHFSQAARTQWALNTSSDATHRNCLRIALNLAAIGCHLRAGTKIQQLHSRYHIDRKANLLRSCFYAKQIEAAFLTLDRVLNPLFKDIRPRIRTPYTESPMDPISIIYEQVDTLIVSNQGVRHMRFAKAISTVTLDLWPLTEFSGLLALPLWPFCTCLLLLVIGFISIGYSFYQGYKLHCQIASMASARKLM